jgi:predicted membrane protein
MDLKIECGVGKSNFELGGLTLTGLDVQTGVGETTLDLIGDWKRDLHASVKGGIGQVTLRLPDKIGVRVQAQKAIGSIQATGLRKENDAYVNDAFGKSQVTLHLHIQTGIGEIRLESGG